jgi:hypothetical protein
MIDDARILVALLSALGLTACGGAPNSRSVDASDVAAPSARLESTDGPERIEVAMPKLAADASCRQARAAYVETWELARGQRAADLSRGQFGMILSRDSYFNHCRVPARFEVSICAAVQNGQVLGATVATKPRAPWIERCIDQGVRELSFPDSPRMDVTTTVFRR